MPVELDHLIVHARDKRASAAFLADMLGLPPPVAVGHFYEIRFANGVALDFSDAGETFTPQHYAFAVTDREFDALLERIRDRQIPHWADPQQTLPGQVADRGGGRRAVYFADPSNYWIEVLIGSGSSSRFGPWNVTVVGPTQPTLLGSDPNPVLGQTTIRFYIPASSDARLDVYGPDGRQVRTMEAQSLSPGANSFIWDRTDQQGRLVAKGTYFYSVTVGSAELSGKLMVLR